MAEEYDLDLDLNDDPQINNRAEQRIKDLSSKVREKAQETEAERKAREEAETRAAAAEKRAEFLESFSDVAAKYPGASDFKAQIEERVQKGYTVEDATVSVLNAEGKFAGSAQEAPLVPITQDTAAGGSAVTTFGDGRSASDMTREEKRALLEEADKNGELAQILQRGL